MSRHYLKFLFLSFSLFCCEGVVAKEMIDCRVMTGDMTECNPYGKRLHQVKEVTYKSERQKLIIVKKLSKPNQQRFVKVISVKDMVSEYIYFEDSLHPKQSDKVVSSETLASKSSEHKVQVLDTKKDIERGYYSVVKGDSLSKIAKKLGIKMASFKKLNALNNTSTLQIGQKLKTPFEQKAVDALVRTNYTVEKGDTLLSISKMFKLPAKDIVTFNRIKNATTVQEGKVLKLPIPYILDKLDAFQEKSKGTESGKRFDINAFGTHKLRVTATAYTSHGNQTDDTPFLAAWNNQLRPGMKIIAVSRDLLTRFGMRNGTKVRIGGLNGYYRVRDKMNKRYKKRIDIYMGLNLKKALRWGKRSVVIYW